MKAVVLNTSQLRAGDRITMHGATVLLQGEPIVYSGYGGRTAYSWREMPIVEGSIDTFPRLKTWTIQGNDLANWIVERD